MAREKGMGNLQREKSGRWTMRVGINGKRYCRSTRTKDKEQAERFLQRFLAPLGLGERRLPLADVWNAYLMSPDRNELAPATLNSKRIVWMHFCRWMEQYYLPVKDLSGVTHEMIGEYLAILRANHCGSTYNGRVCVLREIFRTLASKAGVEDDPWDGVRLRPDDSHSRRELTMGELKRLLEAAKRYDEEERVENRDSEDITQTIKQHKQSNNFHEWHTLFLIGIYTGLRLGDCCRLDWSSINVAQGIIQLIPRKTRRHAHGRPVTIPIHPVLGSALLDARYSQQGSTNTPPSGPVLQKLSQSYETGSSYVANGLKRIFAAANITTSVKLEGRRVRTPEATFHSLRHTFVSFSANAGVPLHIVQSIVGHESTAMTRHYYHENVESLRQAVAAIPTL